MIILISSLFLIYSSYYNVYSYQLKFMNHAYKIRNICIQEKTININQNKRNSITHLFAKKRLPAEEPSDKSSSNNSNNKKESIKNNEDTSSINDDASIEMKTKVTKVTKVPQNKLTAKESKIKKIKIQEKDADKLGVFDDIPLSLPTLSSDTIVNDNVPKTIPKITNSVVSSDSISSFLPNLDEDLAELEANLGVLGEEFGFDSELDNDDDPLAALRRLEGLGFDVDDEEILKSLEFGDEKDSVMEDIDLTDKQLQDALLELDNNDFNIDELMRMTLSKDEDIEVPRSKPNKATSNGMSRAGLVSPMKKMSLSANRNRNDDDEEEDESEEEEDEEEEEEESVEEEDSEDLAGISMRRTSVSDEDEDLMLDVIADPMNIYDDDYDDEDDEEDSILRPSKSKTKAPMISEISPNIKKTTQQFKNKRSDIIKDVSKLVTDESKSTPLLEDSEDLELGIVDPPPLEEFKRLMESLGPDSMFEDDTLFGDEDSNSFNGEDDSDIYTYGSNAVSSGKNKKSSNALRTSDILSFDGIEGDVSIDADEDPEEEGEKYSAPTAKRASGVGRISKTIEESEREREEIELADPDKTWLPDIYEGGVPSLLSGNKNQSEYIETDLKSFLHSHDDPTPWRVQIVTVVTNSTQNSTALEYVQKVYDFIKAGTDNDERIVYQTLCFSQPDGKPFEELDDMIQMWIESYNTYHLIDGAAMKEAWGAIMPHIMLSEKNLNAILEQVQWALSEDQLDGAILTPRLRRVRFRGGAQEMTTGYNTEFLDSEFSVVSVR